MAGMTSGRKENFEDAANGRLRRPIDEIVMDLAAVLLDIEQRLQRLEERVEHLYNLRNDGDE